MTIAKTSVRTRILNDYDTILKELGKDSKNL